MVNPELTDWPTMHTHGDVCPSVICNKLALISRHKHKNNMTSQAHASNCIFSLYGNIVVDTLELGAMGDLVSLLDGIHIWIWSYNTM